MECFVVTSGLCGRMLASKLEEKTHDLFLLFFLCFSFTGSVLLAFWSLGISGLFAGADTEPLGKLGLGSLGPFGELFLPASLEHLCSDDFSASFVQLLPVTVGSCVCPSLILGEHVDGWRMSSCEGFRVKTLLDSFVSELKLLPFLKFFELIILVKLPLLVIVLVSL